MGKYVNTIVLNKDATQVKERVNLFLSNYGFFPSKKGDWYERGKGFWEAKKKFSWRYENGVLRYEAWLGKNMDPSDGKVQASMIKKSYMAELQSFDTFISGELNQLPEVTYSPKGVYVGLGLAIVTIFVCVFTGLISLWFPFASLVATIPNGPKSKAKGLAWVVIVLDILLLIYWLLSAVFNVVYPLTMLS